jgi:hypothetical protein
MKFRFSACGAMSVIFFLFIVFYAVSEFRRREPFWTSPGTMVQLETSHVPTQEDLRHLERERYRIHRDLVNLTGSA